MCDLLKTWYTKGIEINIERVYKSRIDAFNCNGITNVYGFQYETQ